MATPRTLELAFVMAGKLLPSFMDSAKTVTGQLAAVEKKTKDIQTATERRNAQKAWKDFGASVKNAKSAVSGLKSEVMGTFKAAAGLFAANGLIGGAIYGVSKSSANYADAAVKSAQGLGMTTEAYTELAYAATMAGASEQQFAMASGKISKLVADAASGNQKATDVFLRAGIAIRDSAGNLKGVEQLWGEFSDVFASMPDGVGKTSLAIAMFGEQGAKLIPFLNAGKKGMDDARKAAQEMGVTLSKQDGINAEAFNDSFANIGHSMRGVSLIAGKHLWPVFTKIHTFIGDKIVVAGQELAKRMPEWARMFSEGWDKLVPKLDEAWESIRYGAYFVDGFAQTMGGWIPLLKSVVKYWAIWRGIRIGKSLWDTGKAVADLRRKFLGLQYAGTSIGGVFKQADGKIFGFLKSLGSGMKRHLGTFATTLKSGTVRAFSWMGHGVVDGGKFVGGKVSAAFSTMASSAASGMRRFGSASAKAMQAAMSATARAGSVTVKGMGNVLRRGILTSTVGAFKAAGRGAWNFAGQMKNAMQAAGRSVVQFGASAAAGVKSFVLRIPAATKAMGQFAMATGRNAAGAVKAFGQSLLQGVRGAGAFAAATGRAAASAVRNFVTAIAVGTKSVAVFVWQTGVAAVRGMYSFAAATAQTAVKALASFASAVWMGVKADAALLKSMLMTAGRGMAGMARAVAGVLVPALSTMATALWAGAVAAAKFGIALLANPIGLAIAGIVALGAAVYLCVKHWDKITAAMSAAWDWIKGVFVAGWNMLPGWIQEPLAGAYAAVSTFCSDVLGFLGGLWDGIAGYFSGKKDAVVAAFDKGILSGIWEALKQFSPVTLVSDALTGIVNFIKDFDILSAGLDLAKRLGQGIINGLAGIGDSVKSAVVEWIPGGESIVNGIGAAKDAVSGAASRAWGSVKGLFSSSSTASIPQFANGGIVTSPQVALIGEAGPEVVVPVSRPSRARGLMAQAAGMMGIGGDTWSSVTNIFNNTTANSYATAGDVINNTATLENRARDLMGMAADLVGMSGGARGGDHVEIDLTPKISINIDNGGSVEDGLMEKLPLIVDAVMRAMEIKGRNGLRTGNV